MALSASATETLTMEGSVASNVPSMNISQVLDALDQGTVGLDTALQALRGGPTTSSDPHVSLVADAIQLFNRVLDRSKELEKQLEEERAARNRAELRAYAAFQELERLRRGGHEAPGPQENSSLGPRTLDSTNRRVRVGMRDTGEYNIPPASPGTGPKPEPTFGLKFRKWLLGY
jgi:hypothetical protein